MIKYISKNRSYEKLIPKGVVLHETATPGATAENEYNYFNNGNRGASAHAFVDWNGFIQTVPYNEVAWHAGYTANHKYIGVEMCRPKTHNPEQFKKVWDNTISLFICILSLYKLSADDIFTHHQISLKWGETDHTDPTAFLKEYGKTFEDFKNEIKEKMEGGLSMTQYEELKRLISANKEKVYHYTKDIPEYGRKTIQKLLDKGYLKGESESDLNLPESMFRTLVILDRAGVFDK